MRIAVVSWLRRVMEEWQNAYEPFCPSCRNLRATYGCRLVRGRCLGVIDGHRTWEAEVVCALARRFSPERSEGASE